MSASICASLLIHGVLIWSLSVRGSVPISKSPALASPSDPIATPAVDSHTLAIELVVLRERSAPIAPALPVKDKPRRRAVRAAASPKRQARTATTGIGNADVTAWRSASQEPLGPSTHRFSALLRGPATTPRLAATIPKITAPAIAPQPKDGMRSQWKPAGNGEFRMQRPGFSAHIARDGSVAFSDRNASITSPISMQFDVTDAVMRSHGLDPYLSEKLAILDKSREQRVEMARNERRERLRNSTDQLPEHLRRVFTMTTMSTDAKKRALFVLWDECAERGASEVVSAGEQARATILRFIQRELPPGSPHAFTPGEITELNQHRMSTKKFKPYR